MPPLNNKVNLNNKKLDFFYHIKFHYFFSFLFINLRNIVYCIQQHLISLNNELSKLSIDVNFYLKKLIKEREVYQKEIYTIKKWIKFI
jgi:hypothetical protein